MTSLGRMVIEKSDDLMDKAYEAFQNDDAGKGIKYSFLSGVLEGWVQGCIFVWFICVINNIIKHVKK
jgi:hypothetical protein|nr:MAG TPA: hypothetical protein [Caudoviricetes sp.]